MKNDKFTKIGVYDSGIGGVSILKEMIKIIRGDIIYLSDSKNNPYGDKEENELKKIIFSNIDFLIKNKCNPIVIACNTATAVAIDELRIKYPDITFIGTEPAIKTVFDLQEKNKKTLFLSTKVTSESIRVKNLINKYKIDDIVIYPAIGLADIIENKNYDLIDKYFIDNFNDYKDFDYVILGCTHYPLIKDKFKKYFDNAKIIDSGVGVSKQVKRIIDKYNFTFIKDSITFIDTSNKENKKDIFEYYLNK